MISSEFPPTFGGVGSYAYNLSRTLVKKGHRITVITARRSIKDPQYENLDGITVIRVPFLRLYPFHIALLDFFARKFFYPLEKTFTIVHSHTPMPLSVKTFLPVLTTVHTPMRVDGRHNEIFDFKSLVNKLISMVVYPYFEHKLFNNSKQITAVSRMVAIELEEYGLYASRIPAIGNGVDEKTFIPSQSKNRIERYVLYTGVLRARKGLFDFVKCAQIVCNERKDVKFVICGSGPFLNKLHKYVHEMGLQKNVIFLGYVPRATLIETYQNATVHVIPSHYEGLPTVLLEGMSCGLPVVATDIGGNNEVIASGVNGLLVPPKSPIELAQAILLLLDNPELRERLGDAARKTIENRYTWDKIADRLLSCYQNLLQSTN
jgi:glycosyltransferase involved in cell wall biosynthesis